MDIINLDIKIDKKRIETRLYLSIFQLVDNEQLTLYNHYSSR